MTQSLTSLDSLLLTVVLATLAIGLPIFFVLAIRFFWERKLSLGRSKELEKLIWQLHRIASALEHQMSLSFPPVQPGTEEPRDLVYMQPPAMPGKPAAASAMQASVGTPVAEPAQPGQPTPQATAQRLPPLTTGEAGAEGARHGVNSMFGL